MKRIMILACLALAAAPGSTQPPAERDARLEELERKLEVLSRDLENLRLGEAAAEPALKPEKGFGPAASKVYRVRRGVSIGGYGEVIYEDFDRKKDDGAPSGKTDAADALRAVFYFGYKFSDRFLFNSELEFEHAASAKSGEISAEFAYVDCMLTPSLGLRSGLLLAPMGILNELHEPPTFHGIKRTETESAIIPGTWRENGAGLFGEHGPVSWRAYVMNGLRAVKGTSPAVNGFTDAGLRDARQSGSKARAEDLGVAARLEAEPLPGTVLGGSLYAGDSGQGERDAQGLVRARTRIYEGHARWQGGGLEARALYALAKVGDAARLTALNGKTVGSRMTGWYGELAYDVLALLKSEKSLSPFVRYERLNTQDKVPTPLAASKANDQTIITFGLGFKPHPGVAFKADYQNRKNEAGTGIDQWNLAVNWLF